MKGRKSGARRDKDKRGRDEKEEITMEERKEARKGGRKDGMEEGRKERKTA